LKKKFFLSLKIKILSLKKKDKKMNQINFLFFFLFFNKHFFFYFSSKNFLDVMHRDLKPENILFRKPNDYSSVVIAGN
jgi:serine/threonine protein kinase